MVNRVVDVLLKVLVLGSLAATIAIGIIFVHPIAIDQVIFHGKCNVSEIHWISQGCTSTEKDYYTPNIQGYFIEAKSLNFSTKQTWNAINYDWLYFNVSVPENENKVLFHTEYDEQDMKLSTVDCSSLTSINDSEYKLVQIFPQYIPNGINNSYSDSVTYNSTTTWYFDCFYYADVYFKRAVIYHKRPNKIYILALFAALGSTLLFAQIIHLHGQDDVFKQVIDGLHMLVVLCMWFLSMPCYMIYWFVTVCLCGKSANSFMELDEFIEKGSVLIPVIYLYKKLKGWWSEGSCPETSDQVESETSPSPPPPRSLTPPLSRATSPPPQAQHSSVITNPITVPVIPALEDVSPYDNSLFDAPPPSYQDAMRNN